MRNVSGLEAVYRDYGPKGVNFYFIYKSLAHPELNGNYIQPFTLDERLAHARQAEQQLGATIPWLVDPIDNRLKHALGDRANSEFIVDPQGKIVRKRAWSDPVAVRKDLEELVGPSETVTQAEDLQLDVRPPLAEAAEPGAAAKVSRAGMFPLVSEPQLALVAAPFYAKLRAEADLDVIDGSRGRLYLGFHLDPFHGAHWNNLIEPLEFEIAAGEGVKLSQRTGKAPRMAAETDVDPREFLLEVESWPEDQDVRVTVIYAACTDEECHRLRQEYVLHRRRDADGGNALVAGFRAFKPQEMLDWLMAKDANGDGKLARDELNSLLKPRVPEFDKDGDGQLDEAELRPLVEQSTSRAKF